LLHLGVSGSALSFDDETARFRSRPESHLAPRFVDTGNFAADNGAILGTEATLAFDSFSLQGEYLRHFTDTPDGRDPAFDGFYLSLSYFLTGEHRPYKKSSAVFDRVHPKRNFSLGGGPGAWELAVRYSYLNLNDENIQGGRLKDLTFGINWYWNPNMRLMLNYIYSDVGGDQKFNGRNIDGNAHILQTRAMVDF